MRHKVTINVGDSHGREPVLRGALRWMPEKLVKWIFGDFQQIYILKPGTTVTSVDIKEEK